MMVSLFISDLISIKIPLYFIVCGVIVFWLIISMAMAHEKYFEFRDQDFYIYDSQYYNKLEVMLSILKNDTLDYAFHYKYSDISKVYIFIEKKYTSIGYGVSKFFKIIYKLKMNDGNMYMIDSTFSSENSKQRKTVFDILDYHNVQIVDSQNFREAIVQEEMSLYEYLDTHIV